MVEQGLVIVTRGVYPLPSGITADGHPVVFNLSFPRADVHRSKE